MSTQSSPPYSETDRNLALVAYGLLGIAIFFAGLPALVAAVIAYSQRRAVHASIAQHHAFQIRIFWVAFIMSLIATLSLIGAAITGIGDLIAFLNEGGWDRMTGGTVTMAQMRVDAVPLTLLGITTVLTVLAGIWLIAASAFGALRLVNQRAFVQAAA
ncbi:MAG: hypothetical protein JWP35_771 [Caulobacter sp.]|nr:hypothetical protein [Caulobacter sp.]